MQKTTVGILIYNNVEVLDFTGPYEVFSVTRLKNKPEFTDPSPFKILLISEYPRPVSAMGGMKTIPDHTFEDCPKLDILIVPGGLGERTEHENHVILHFLRSRARKVKTLASVCTGAFFLGKAGLLNGRKATTHFLSLGRMRDLFPEVDVIEDEHVVEDADIFTSAGISAGIDMALRVVAKHFGENTARLTAREMEYPYPENNKRKVSIK